MVSDTRSHPLRDSQTLMNPAEVVVPAIGNTSFHLRRHLDHSPYPLRSPPRFARGVFNAINFTTTRNRYFRVCG